MNSTYQEFKPSAALEPFVDYYWLHTFEADGNQESPVQRCLPFGTLEIILHLDDNHCQVLHNNYWQKLPHGFFVGLYRDAVQWKCVGSGRKFGIQLKPESLLQLFNIPVASLFNNFTDLETFFGKEINRLVEKVYGQLSIHSVIAAAEAFLLAQRRNLNAERNYLFEATRLIRQSRGNLSIEAVSEHIYVSKRQLERSFKDNYGTTPKMYQRIIRFRNAYEYFYQKPTAPDWQDISYTFGYSDQAHFIRDFKEFTDDVPTVVFNDTNQQFQRPTCWGTYARA
ncbi:AraC family transcriptional regulator [Spirosoma sp. KNUC1025]|uniref:helix-turn-helix domain-containing protein n=1 Tax=Spirosoma sp. KNUC1025 TaxID=2894082 RepID=UPI0038631447|nr:AraC family transcriptional regulator [Spirosoma sp. KNUC1025]